MSSSNNNDSNFDFLNVYGQEILDEEDLFDEKYSQLVNLLKAKKEQESQTNHEGGIKTIYAVDQSYAKRIVAKAYLKNRKPDKKLQYEFIREAIITSRLNHPNIVPIYDLGISDNDQPYFTMKMLGGENLGCILQKLIKNEPEYKQKFPLSTCLDIFIKVCHAVAYAHSQGILHLDLKPENIQVNDYGEVLLIDWGLAWDMNDDNDWEEGLIKGSPGYMAPEQIRGDSELFTPPTDIYALGALLYSILTLKRPSTQQDTKKQLQEALSGHLPPPQERAPDMNVPFALNAVTIKAMALEPEARYQNVNELIKEINDYQNGFATVAEEAGPLTLLKLFYIRHRPLCLTAFAAIIFIAAALFMFIKQLKENERLAIESKNKIEAVLSKLKESETKRYHIATETSDYMVKIQRDQQINQNFEEAERSLENLTQLEIDNFEFWYELGRLKLSRLDFKSAYDCFLKTAELGEKDFKYNQNFLAVSQEYLEISKNRKLNFEDFKQLYIRLPYAQIRTYLCKILYTQHFQNLNETISFVKFCAQETTGSSEAFEIKVIDQMLDLNLKGNKNIKLLYFLGGLPIQNLNLQNSTVTSNRYFHQNKFNYLNINNTRMNDLEIISAAELHAENIEADLVIINRRKMPVVNFKRAKIKELVFQKATEIDEFFLNKANIESLKIREGFSIKKLYLEKEKQKIKQSTLNTLIDCSQEVIYR